MKKILIMALMLVVLVGSVAAVVVFPSTNDVNRGNGWAHVDEISVAPGEVTLEFIQPRNFYACFEYRTDGDISQVIAENGGVNYNVGVSDGLYPYFCQKANSRTEAIQANEYVEVRMAFGAESDERFDWTRFDVEPVQNDVPEFGLLGATVLVAGLIGFVIWKRK